LCKVNRRIGVVLAGPPNRKFGSLEAAMAPDRPPMPDAFSGSAG
jgi:hypothetical protein